MFRMTSQKRDAVAIAAVIGMLLLSAVVYTVFGQTGHWQSRSPHLSTRSISRT